MFQTTNTTTNAAREAGATEFMARAKAFSGQGVRSHRFLLSSDRLRVWDDVAGHYTTCHSLSAATQRRLARLHGAI